MMKMPTIGQHLSKPIMDTRSPAALVEDHHDFYDEGHREAAHEAILVSVEHKLPIPDWVHPELQAIAKEELKLMERRPRTRGPRRHYLQSFCDNWIHHTICAAVLMARALGYAHYDAIYWAHRVLEEEDIKRTIDTVETTYKDVLRDLRRGGGRYNWNTINVQAHVLRETFERLIAIEGH